MTADQKESVRLKLEAAKLKMMENNERSPIVTSKQSDLHYVKSVITED